MKKNRIHIIASILMALLFSACEEIIMEGDISDRHVTLLAPAEGSQLTATSLTFSWEEIEDASGYRLQIARPDFVDPEQIVLDTLVSSTHFSTQLNIGAYHWRVKAVNSGYQTDFTDRSFSVISNENFQNNVVVLQSPVNNITTTSNAQTLSWQALIGATSYQLQVYDATGTVVLDQNLASNSFAYTFGEGSYQWRVRASNGSQYTLYSTRSLFVDSQAPNTPALLLPANNANVPEGDVAFHWSRASVAGTTESDSIYIYSNNTLTNLLLKDAAGSSPYTLDMEAGTYYWYMKAFDAAGNQSAQSSIFSFTAN